MRYALLPRSSALFSVGCSLVTKCTTQICGTFAATSTGVVTQHWPTLSGRRHVQVADRYGENVGESARRAGRDGVPARVRVLRSRSCPALLCAQYFYSIFQRHGSNDVGSDAFAEHRKVSIRKWHAAGDDVGLDVDKIVPCAANFSERV